MNLKSIKFNECYNSHSSEYPGGIYLNIFNHSPNVYSVYLNKKEKLKYNLAHLDYTFKEDQINEIKINSNIFIDKAKKDSHVSVYSFSHDEYMILCTEEGHEFLIIEAINNMSATDAYKIYVYTHNDIKDIIDIISPWFTRLEKELDKVEFGIAAIDCGGNLYTTYYDYKYPEVDIKKNYNDDLPYKQICKLIENEGISELLLFYGDPGTGKTTLIKHLINKYPDKNFVFLDGSLLINAQQTNLMSYFLENQDTVFILEDCEKVLTSREDTINPVMPVLLNITDGIIGDVLGIKIICTFNTSLDNIDKALLRKGRLSLKYEFKPLCLEKVKKLLGKDADSITKDMNLADIYNLKIENDFSKKKTKKIGF